MKVFLTGGTGFIGGALARRLAADGYEIRALVRPGADTRALEGLVLERVEGDLSDLALLREKISGCGWVFHVAALYSYWGHRWQDFYRANVEGTRNVLEAAGAEGVERVVYTSSIAALGVPREGRVANEETPAFLDDRIGKYQRSKFMAQEIAHDFARQGLPLIIVNPSSPVGVGDHKPTPTGQIIVDYLNGRMFGYVDTGLNIVDVEDVAAGHLLAAARGRIGEKYILGGENLTLKQILDMLAEVSGLPRVRLRIPHWVALGYSWIDATLASIIPGRMPAATPEKVRLSRRREFFDPAKAWRELELPKTPAREALSKAVAWYRNHGYAPR